MFFTPRRLSAFVALSAESNAKCFVKALPFISLVGLWEPGAGDGWGVKETRESGQSPAESATSDLILYYSSFHLIFHYPYITLYKPRIVIASILFSIISPIVASISSSIIPVLFLSVRLSSLPRTARYWDTRVP